MENKKESYYSSINKLKSEFYKTAKGKYNLKRQECFDIFDDVFATVIESIYNNEETKIRGFGKFKVNERYVSKPKTFFALNGKDKDNNYVSSQKQTVRNKKSILFVPSKHIIEVLNKAEKDE